MQPLAVSREAASGWCDLCSDESGAKLPSLRAKIQVFLAKCRSFV
jgi:hypothetical protein